MTGPAWMDEPLTTIAYLWRLARRDGVVLGFTSHDRDLCIGSIVYQAAPGMLPTSLLQLSGMEAGGLDVEGALTADAIRAEDVLAGRWDGARLSIYLANWIDASAALRHLASGELGNFSRSGESFRAELRSLAAALDAPVAPLTSPTCRAAFGDTQCGVARHRFRNILRVVEQEEERLRLTFEGSPDDGIYDDGVLRWLEGPNCGISQAILASRNEELWLADPPPFDVTPGQAVEVLQGCDHTIATCANRFGNAVNFRGEPYLPGNDLLTRYPGAA